MAESPRRVLHVTQPTITGVAVYVADLVRDQAAHGDDVHLAAPPGTFTAALADVATIHPWPATRDPGMRVPGELRRFARIVDRVRPDLCHLHAAKAGLVGRAVLRGRVPTVFQPHAWSFEAVTGSTRRAALTWERLAARWTTVTICVSTAERDRGRRHGITGPITVVTNGVATDRFRPEPRDAHARDRLGLPSGPVVLFVGRLAAQKGIDVLLAAWPRVRTAMPDATLVVVGDGPERAAVRAAEADGVRALGPVTDPAGMLAQADVVVLPSRWEGLSLVLLEAMAVGASIVASDVDGVTEALGDAGAVIPAGRPDALAAAVVRRLRDPDLRAREGRAARAAAERAFDVRRTRREVRVVHAAVVG